MGILKIYASNRYLSYTTFVEHKGSMKLLEFRGGMRYGQKTTFGTFSTCDTALQESIEDSSLFTAGHIVLQAPKMPISIKQQVSVLDPNIGTYEASAPVEVPDVTNLQQAKEYLKKQGVAATKLTTPESIMAESKAKGYDFVNLTI